MSHDRKTIKAATSLVGIGIHSGKTNTIQLHPAEPGTGIIFEYQGTQIPATVAFSLAPKRATILEKDGVKIITPEHLLSACAGYGITDLRVTVTESEIPILDGSAKPFTDQFDTVGIQPIPGKIETLVVTNPITRSNGQASIIALPCPTTRFSMMIEYNQFIGVQWIGFELNASTYATDIAPARTYGFKAEVEALLAAGLAKGGAIDNAVIIGDTNYLTPLRFPDELVRHKLLDLIGDIALTGRRVQGHIIGLRSGHDLNRDMAIALVETNLPI